MKTLALKKWIASAGMTFGIGSIAFAAPLDFTGTTARQAATQISDKYGINIVFRGTHDAEKLVTFSVANADSDGGRLQAVNALANAVGADFQKTYVVSKLDANADVPAPKVDTNATIAFPSLTISAQDAVQRVAGADSAVSQYYGTAGDSVTLSALNLSATETAREVSQQTHTRWKVFFALTPRTKGHVLGGKIIGRTASGAPIIEEPYVYYHSTPVEDPPAPVASQNAPNANTAAAGQQQNTGQGYGQAPYGVYGSPYGFDPYYGFNTYAGNNPYSQNVYPGGGSPYGYGFPSNEGSGLVVNGGFGYDNPVVFGGGF